MPAKSTLTPRASANFTTAKKQPPPHLELAAVQAGRAVITEARKAPVPETRPEVGSKGTASAALERMRAAELPVKSAVKRAPSPAVTAATKPVHGNKGVSARDLLAPRVPEKPVHAAVTTKPATTPAMVNRNREKKRAAVIARAVPKVHPILTPGVSPADLANGTFSPGRGIVTTHTLPFPVGTPQSLRLATPEVLESVSTAGAPVMTLPVTRVAADPNNDPVLLSGTGDGAGRFAFLAGAVFVAWLMLGRGA